MMSYELTEISEIYRILTSDELATSNWCQVMQKSRFLYPLNTYVWYVYLYSAAANSVKPPFFKRSSISLERLELTQSNLIQYQVAPLILPSRPVLIYLLSRF